MSSAMEIVFIIIEILEFIMGIWGNAFIGVVICIDFIKSKKIPLFDFILVCLSISRISVLCLLLEDSIRLVFNVEILENHIISIVISIFWNLSHSLSTWCATCLSVFYFLKVSNFSHPFFLWLKWRRDKVVFTILWGFFISLLINLLSIKLYTFWISDYLKMERNMTWKLYVSNPHYYRSLLFLNLVSLIPVTLSLISFFLLIFSLWRHTKQMKRHVTRSGDLNTEVHVRARNTMISFLVHLVVHYLATILLIWSYYTIDNSLSVIIIETVAFLYPSMHPFDMIQRNRKLRQASVNLLRQISSSLKGK